MANREDGRGLLQRALSEVLLLEQYRPRITSVPLPGYATTVPMRPRRPMGKEWSALKEGRAADWAAQVR
jgi:hypothetical protein